MVNTSSLPSAGACTRFRFDAALYCLPSLVVLGAVRAGTSAACDGLARHPRLVRNADGHEVHHFSDPYASSRRTAAAWRAYARRFPVEGTAVLTFEKTAQYLTSPRGLRALARMLPRVVPVVVVREPGDRLYSEFQHHCAAGRVARVAGNARIAATNGRAGRAAPARGAVLRGDALPDGTLVAASTCYAGRGAKGRVASLHARDRERNRNPGWRVAGAEALAYPCAPAAFHAFATGARGSRPPAGDWGELAAGRYAERLAEIRGIFGAPPVVLERDALEADPRAALAPAFAALGLDVAAADFSGAFARSRPRVRPLPMLAATRAWADAYYAAPNAALRSAWGPLGDWS